jgi:hypothetical protein
VRIVVSSVLAAAVSIGAAQAADVARSPVIYQPMPGPVFYNWNGFYVGGFIGGMAASTLGKAFPRVGWAVTTSPALPIVMT